jgi:hypothetical protein
MGLLQRPLRLAQFPVLEFQFDLVDLQVMGLARGVGRVGCLAT